MDGATPRFSIVMPTRNRAHILPFALRSALEQDFDDYEVVVVANDCQDGTRDVVQEMREQRVRYFETDGPLSMPDSWDFAWTKARGQYVTYLADDDALDPSALRVLAERALHDEPEIVCWEDAPYYYPDWHDPQLQNLLLLFDHGETEIEDLPAEAVRRQCAEFSFDWMSPLPKMNNCVARRDILDAWRSRLGRLFFAVTPDFGFAWLVSHVCSSVRLVHRPLTVRGISNNSRGSDAGLSASGIEFLKEFGDLDCLGPLAVRVPTTINLVAATFTRVTALLRQHGVDARPFDSGRHLVALAKQLQSRECRQLLRDLQAHLPRLIAAAKAVSPEVFDAVSSTIAAPVTPPAFESIRELRRRTAEMATEYPGNLERAAVDHLGDEACARCVLGLQNGALASTDWASLYVFGEEIGVFDPYAASKHLGPYYDALIRCREKQRRSREDGPVTHQERLHLNDRLADLNRQLADRDRVIVNLIATADERLRLIEQLNDEAGRLQKQLEAKERVIREVTAAADERLRLLEQANAEAETARRDLDQLTTRLRELQQANGHRRRERRLIW